jgi:(2Fe-2S) ferredoxin
MSYKPEVHLFVCTNQSCADGNCCGLKGGKELREKPKALVKSPDKNWAGRVRVTASGCLGYCDQGIACVIYPQKDWQLQVTAHDAPRLEALIDKYLTTPSAC